MKERRVWWRGSDSASAFKPSRSHASVGLLLAATTVLAMLFAGGWWANSRAAAPRSSTARSQWEHRAFLPMVTANYPPRVFLPMVTVRWPPLRERYGFVALSSNWRQQFDVSQLGAGWYVDTSPPACANSPGGMDRALLIRVRDWSSSRLPWLESMVDNYPGVLWLVGNEPDCIWQDNVLPETYAHIYHQIYAVIKGRDPTALVSPGGIVQPTPLRLAWLDRVLLEYKNTYRVRMPVDVWNIHNAILREVSYLCDPDNAWGADIPPGFDECQGVWREIEDNYRVDIFEAQIWDFREWMALNGYGGHPLVVTEFGILMPVGWAGYDEDDVDAFMDATFRFLRTAKSTTPNTLGDPSDGYHLVQRWAWFSLDNPPYDDDIREPDTYNGNLFDPYTTEITGYGLNFATHTASLLPLGYVELRPVGLWLEPLEPIGATGVVTSTVAIEVENLGNRNSGPVEVRLEFTGPVDGLSHGVITNLAAGSAAWVSLELTELVPGSYSLAVWVDPESKVSEPTECDNELTSSMFVPAHVVYMPLILRDG